MRFFISSAMKVNTFSMLWPVFALVSKNSTPISFAKEAPSSKVTFLSAMSDLLPTRTLKTVSDACNLICFTQF